MHIVHLALTHCMCNRVSCTNQEQFYKQDNNNYQHYKANNKKEYMTRSTEYNSLIFTKYYQIDINAFHSLLIHRKKSLIFIWHCAFCNDT